jgi:branched-chain amino acid transport system permease protein
MLSALRKNLSQLTAPLRRQLARTPLLAYLVGLLGAVLIEQQVGLDFARTLGFRRIPRFFGFGDLFEPFSNLNFSGILAPFFPSPSDVYEQPVLASAQAIAQLFTTFFESLFYQGPRDPGFLLTVARVVAYDFVIFIVPVVMVAFLLRGVISGVLIRLPYWASVFIHISVLCAVILLWGGDGGTRELILVFIGINIILTISLNLVNGYMGEFSVGHAGFMAVGAYVSAVLTMWAFTNDRYFGDAVLPPELGVPFGFVVALLAGGAAAAVAGLAVAFPSFRTRGDYLAIVTLAVNFIVQSAINNMEFVGGPRGLNGVPLWTTLPWVMLFTLLSLFAVYNLVNSTFGKGIIAIREDEIAAELMGVNTKRIKLVAFLASSFMAGVAGGLFAHVLTAINPGTFGILKSTEVLVMVYLGGMGSISGSVIAAVLFTVLVEAMRPLAVLKWVVLPLILIFLMIYRPQGLFGFREIRLNLGNRRDRAGTLEVKDAAAGD